jgi:heme-degrading monooxygenase HmoA
LRRSRESTLSAAPGFIGFTFMRKDGEGKKGKPLPDDVFNYSTCTVWKDYESFVAWQKVRFPQP